MKSKRRVISNFLLGTIIWIPISSVVGCFNSNSQISEKGYFPKKVPLTKIQPSKPIEKKQTQSFTPKETIQATKINLPHKIKKTKLRPAYIKPQYLSEKPSPTLINGALTYNPTAFDKLKQEMLDSITTRYNKYGDFIVETKIGKIHFNFSIDLFKPEYLENEENMLKIVKKFIYLNNFSTDIFIKGLYVNVMPQGELASHGGATSVAWYNPPIYFLVNCDSKKNLKNISNQINSIVSIMLHEYIHFIDSSFNSISISQKIFKKNGDKIDSSKIWETNLKEKMKHFFLELKNDYAKSSWNKFFKKSWRQKNHNYKNNFNPRNMNVKKWYMDNISKIKMKNYYGVDFYPFGFKNEFLKMPFLNIQMHDEINSPSYFSDSYNNAHVWQEITNFFLNNIPHMSIGFFYRIWRESGLNFLDPTYGRVAENIMSSFLHNFIGINNKNGVRIWRRKDLNQDMIEIDFSSIGKKETKVIKEVVIHFKGKKYILPIKHHKLPIGFRDFPRAKRRHKYVVDAVSGKIQIPLQKVSLLDLKNMKITIILQDGNILSNKETVITQYLIKDLFPNIFVFDQVSKKFISILDFI